MPIPRFTEYLDSGQFTQRDDKNKKTFHYYKDYIYWLVFTKNQKNATAEELLAQLDYINLWVMFRALSKAPRQGEAPKSVRSQTNPIMTPRLKRDLDTAIGSGLILSIVTIIVFDCLIFLTPINIPVYLFPVVYSAVLLGPALFTLARGLIAYMMQKPTTAPASMINPTEQTRPEFQSSYQEEISDLKAETSAMLTMRYDAQMSTERSTDNTEVDLEIFEKKLRLKAG